MAKGKRAARPRPASAEDALQEFDALYEAGDLDGAFALAEAGLKLDDGMAALHHARGLALWGLGRHQTASETMQRAVDLDPSLAEAWLDLSTLVSDYLGNPEDALRLLKEGRRAFKEPALRASLHAARAHAWLAMEETRSAEKELLSARKLMPDEADLAVELAEIRIERFDLAGAEKALEEALQLDPDSARGHWLRAVLLDRSGAVEEAGREFERAATLAPEEHFVPERLSDEEFDLQVEKALAAIPRRFRKHLENAEISVEPSPETGLVREEEISPLILGLFVGTPVTHRTFDATDLPPRILIFQRNLENICRSRRELIREIGITLRHEVGHLLGMEEEEIEDAGHG